MSNRVWTRVFGLVLIFSGVLPGIRAYLSALTDLAAEGGVNRIDQQLGAGVERATSPVFIAMIGVGLLLIFVSFFLKKAARR